MRHMINKTLRQIAKEEKIIFLSKQNFQCSDEFKKCDVLTQEGFKIYYDDNHYTIKGAKYFGEKIFKLKMFEMK